jgi:hypothetical protein
MASHIRSTPTNKRAYYHGGNATRASIVQNPAAYANDNSSGLFGVKEFRKYGFASEETRDRAAELQITAGYSKKKNPVCAGCNVMMPTTKVCDNCD